MKPHKPTKNEIAQFLRKHCSKKKSGLVQQIKRAGESNPFSSRLRKQIDLRDTFGRSLGRVRFLVRRIAKRNAVA